MDPQAVVVAFTGAFGSGCTTAAKRLRDTRKFKLLALSDPIKRLWGETNQGKIPSRADFQRQGDQLREKSGTGALVDEVLKQTDKEKLLVIDGIGSRGATLFTTTFPCFQCAEKIAQVGIATVYFSEIYPDPHVRHPEDSSANRRFITLMHSGENRTVISPETLGTA